MNRRISRRSTVRRSFFCIDSHTCGNPLRVVAGGGSLPPHFPMAQRREVFVSDHDWVRTALMFEPRGHDIVSGAIIYRFLSPAALVMLPRHASGPEGSRGLTRRAFRPQDRRTRCADAVRRAAIPGRPSGGGQQRRGFPGLLAGHRGPSEVEARFGGRDVAAADRQRCARSVLDVLARLVRARRAGPSSHAANGRAVQPSHRRRRGGRRGEGVALGWNVVLHGLLERRQLVPFTDGIGVEATYNVLVPSRRRTGEAATAFVAWIASKLGEHATTVIHDTASFCR